LALIEGSASTSATNGPQNGLTVDWTFTFGSVERVNVALSPMATLYLLTWIQT